jgi:hypothetical protein
VAIALLLLSLVGMQLEAGQSPAKDRSHSRDGTTGITITLPRYVGSAVTNAPYSGELIVEDGVQNTTRALVFRNSDGKTRVDGLAGHPAIVEITDPVSGTSDILDLRTQIAHHVRLEGLSTMVIGCCPEKASSRLSTEYFLLNSTGESMPTLAAGARGNGGKFGGLGMIDGLPAEAYSQTVTVPPGGVQLAFEPIVFPVESWYSPTLKVTLLYKFSDSRDGETKIRVTNIKQGEPAPSLFQVPAGYRTINEAGDFTIVYSEP